MIEVGFQRENRMKQMVRSTGYGMKKVKPLFSCVSMALISSSIGLLLI
jgi:hypothetical protein